ncbi:hypothetical protein DID88_008457 [Monilinia fructigena]|uniref:G domain-containing protein n=1 Tax=Monilinia fructigena TaxID=38457 RepID=A0A395J5W4_9HELO|nr:hypothetical protein DID88_008457 [Monilinia fructigena]
MSFGDSPEVCFLGRSNVGKSSLLNALLNSRLAHTSSKPGRTRGYWICRDMGMVEDRNGERKLSKYLEKRKQLKRAFVLIDAEHGIKENDRNESSVEPDPESGDADFTTGEILTCTSEKRAGRKYGVDAVRFAMLRAAGLHIQPKVKLAKPVEMISYEELFERQNTTR